MKFVSTPGNSSHLGQWSTYSHQGGIVGLETLKTSFYFGFISQLNIYLNLIKTMGLLASG